MFHKSDEFRVDVFELCEFIAEHRFDVSRSEENSFKINISALDIEPEVKDNSDLFKSFAPGFNVLLKNFVVGRHFHATYVVHVIVDQRKQVIPSLNQLALALILDQLYFLYGPHLLDLVEEVL